MNHSPTHRILSLLLAVLVLTASVGLTVQRHSCRFSKRSRVQVDWAGLAKPVPGCGGQRVPARLKNSCCEFNSHLHKLATPAHHYPVVAVPGPTLAAVCFAALTWPDAPCETAVYARCGATWFAADSSPPPLGGRELLTFVSKLVV